MAAAETISASEGPVGTGTGAEMARPSLERSVKFKALVRALGIPKPYVLGLLETMWLVCHESGNPTLGSPAEVEAAAEWPGKPGEFFEAIRGRWIDEVSPGVWAVHDYWDHAPEYVTGRAERERLRKTPRTCARPGCGREFRSPDRRCLYCSPSCRTLASRERTAAKGDGPGAVDGQLTDPSVNLAGRSAKLTQVDTPPNSQHPSPPQILLGGATPPKTPRAAEADKDDFSPLDPPGGFPAVLDTPEFRAAWSEWCAHRRDIRKKLTARAVKQQLTDLAIAGPAAAVEAIHSSIRNGYQGLFPRTERTNGTTQRQAGPSKRFREEADGGAGGGGAGP
jgi:hypothetical protein